MNTEQDERLAEIRNLSGDRSLFDHHDMRFILSQLDARDARIADLEAMVWAAEAKTAETRLTIYEGKTVVEIASERNRLAAALAQAEAARDAALQALTNMHDAALWVAAETSNEARNNSKFRDEATRKFWAAMKESRAILRPAAPAAAETRETR